MLIYVYTALLSCVFVVSASMGQRTKQQQWALWVLAFLIMWLPAAVRLNIGVDYSRFQGYSELYTIYGSGSSIVQGMDIGFIVLIRVLWMVSKSSQVLFAVTSAFIYLLILRAVKRLSIHPALSITLFFVAGFYFETYNIIRQWMALACVFNALEWIVPQTGIQVIPTHKHHDDKKTSEVENIYSGFTCFMRYAAWVLLGASFHVSALIFLLLWPFYFLKLNSKRSLVLLAGLFVLGFVAKSTGKIVLSGTRFGRYLYDGASVYAAVSPHWDSIIVMSICLAFMVWQLRDKRELDRWGNTMLLLAVLGCASALAGLYMPFIFDRIARYFAPFILLELPFAVMQEETEYKRYAYILAIMACWLLATFIRVYFGGQFGVLPFQSIFFNA
ncbi:EpsG family protein [Atopobium fossor]|uniref:EpsG family protein n=1 Tax=Atopobium fossor TaxID=39487 RepID=UPI0004058FE2|nr:EpsG family protein [Atopobium fossor]